MNKPPMAQRAIRVPDDIWEAAKAKANDRGENLSEVLRRFLERYVQEK